tara:strand:+ start:296 stop:460 length:165 start_codon:yes stop_codon:yes gene_type:complete
LFRSKKKDGGFNTPREKKKKDIVHNNNHGNKHWVEMFDQIFFWGGLVDSTISFF